MIEFLIALLVLQVVFTKCAINSKSVIALGSHCIRVNTKTLGEICDRYSGVRTNMDSDMDNANGAG